MMDIAKSETFKYFTILSRALLLLIKVNKTAVQSVPKISLNFMFEVPYIRSGSLENGSSENAGTGKCWYRKMTVGTEK